MRRRTAGGYDILAEECIDQRGRTSLQPTDHHQKLARTQAIEQTPGPDCLWTPVSLCRRFLGWPPQLVELAGMVPLLHARCR
jgi:hypothetical protein